MATTAAILTVCALSMAALLVVVHRNITAEREHPAAPPPRRLKACQCCGSLIGRQWRHDDTLCQPKDEKL